MTFIQSYKNKLNVHVSIELYKSKPRHLTPNFNIKHNFMKSHVYLPILAIILESEADSCSKTDRYTETYSVHF